MKYDNVVYGEWIERINRFTARVRIGQEEARVHVKNTGRLRELLIRGAKVALEPAQGEKRVTKFSLVAVRIPGGWVNVDSQAPNEVARAALAAGVISEIGTPEEIRREVRYGQSRIDLQYRTASRLGFVEVKGVTLVEGGVARFPDAPTERGTKHVKELIAAAQEGFEAVVLFVIQREDAHRFEPNASTDGVFARALKEAAASGVQILAYRCTAGPDTLCLDKPVDVTLGHP